MFQFIGYNFFSDGDALNSAPSNVTNITSTTISNAIFDHINISKNTNQTFSATIPTEWDYYTVLDCDFENNIAGGNIEASIAQINLMKIRRRVKGGYTWLTLGEVPIRPGHPEDLNFVFNDLLNADLVTYEYALVPTYRTETQEIEGEMFPDPPGEVLSQFNGVFIGDAETIYKFLYDVNYGTNARNQQIGTFEPLGSQFPIIVSNGILSYDSGTVSATIMNDAFEDTGVIDVTAITEKKELIKDFLTNKKAKILKDWSGNMWLCACTSSPQVTYKSNSGMRIPQIQFDWKQIGLADKQQDLYNNGIIDVTG